MNISNSIQRRVRKMKPLKRPNAKTVKFRIGSMLTKPHTD